MQVSDRAMLQKKVQPAEIFYGTPAKRTEEAK